MKKFLLFLIIFSSFFAVLLAQKKTSTFDFTAKTQAGSLYLDDSGQSLFYNADFNTKINTDKSDFFINAAYKGACSKLENASGFFNGGIFSAAFAKNCCYFDTGLFLGNFPSSFNLNFNDIALTLNDLFFIGGFSSFAIDFSSDFALKLQFALGNQQSQVCDLFLLFGSLKNPILGNGNITLSLPYDLELYSSYSGTAFKVFSRENNKIGNGELKAFNISAGKKWTLSPDKEEVSQELRGNHNFITGLGFFYLEGSGNLTADSDMYSLSAYPFSYLHADASADLYFLSFDFDYIFKKNNFQLSFDSNLLLNIYSKIDYFYKATFKKNLFYDGSVKRKTDSLSFSNGDSLIWGKLQFLYHKDFSSKKNIELYLAKAFIIPIITQNTKNLFSLDSSSAANQTGYDFSSELLKTILLSGLSAGLTFNF